MSEPRARAETLLDRIRRRPAFRAFAVLAGERIKRGKTLDVLWMLQEVGAPANVAHEIIEGWPTDSGMRIPLLAGLTHSEIVAYWLASHIDDIDRYNWPILLLRSLKAALHRRTELERGTADQEQPPA